MKKSEKKTIPSGFLAMIVLCIFVAGISAILVSGHKINVRQQNAVDSKKIADNTSSYDSVSGLSSDAISPNAFEDSNNLPEGMMWQNVHT